MKNYIKLLSQSLPVILSLYLVYGSVAYAQSEVQTAYTAVTLQQAVQTSLSGNREFISLIRNAELAGIDIETARAEFGTRFQPSFSTDSRLGTDIGQSYNLNINKKFKNSLQVSLNSGTSVFNNSYLSEVNLQFTQPLLKGRGRLAATSGLASAQSSNERQGYMRTAAEEELIFNVIRGYYQVVLHAESIEVQKKALERAGVLLNSSAAKLEAGLVSKMDVFRAEIQLFQAKENLENAEDLYANARDILVTLLGLPTGTELDVVPELQYSLPDIEEEILVGIAHENRAEMKDAKRYVRSERRNLKVTENNALPPLDLTVKVSRLGRGTTFGESAELDETRVGIGITSSTDLWMTVEKANYRKAMIAYKNSLRSRDDVRDKITREVRENIRQLESGFRRIELRKKRLEGVENQSAYALIRYRKGLGDNLEVVDAEKQLVDARNGLTAAIVEYIIAENRLLKVTGMLTGKWKDVSVNE
ncbi:TolC family protein [bacterium]|nr:TolC family protein [bacterium]